MTVDDLATPAVAAAAARPEYVPSGAGRSPGALIVAWQHPTRRLIAPVGLLENGSDVGGYRFRYLRRAADIPDFQPFLSFPDLERTYVSPRLFPLFSQRVMSPRRPDYGEFLRQLDLDQDASPWEQLARSEGRRTGDTVQLFPIPSVRVDGRSMCRFLVHGIRHVTGGALPPLSPGAELTLRDEPTNPINAGAVLVCTSAGDGLGYVPDLLLEHLRALQSSGPVRLAVEHVNGLEAPAHLRLLVKLEGSVPPGYLPMSGPGWETYG